MMLISRLLVAVMLACLIVPVVLIVEWVYPSWEGEFLIPLGFFVALEALYSHYRLRGVNFISAEWWYSRAAEWIVLLILIKLVLYGLRGFDRLWIDLQLWRENFFQYFFSPEYLFVILTALAIWVLCGNIEYLFSQIEVDEQLLKADIDTRATGLRIEVRRQLANLMILVGGIMVVIVALLNLSAEAEGSGSQIVDQGVIAIMVYFLCGLVLLSLTQFSILRARWIVNHIQISQKVTTSWFVYSLILILILASLSILLPTGYSKQLLRVLQLGFTYFIDIILIIYYLLITPIILLVRWLMSLFKLTPRPVPYEAPRPELFTPPPLISRGPIVWWELIKTVLFWGTLIGLVGYAFVYYFRENPQYFTWMRGSRVFTALTKFWKLLAEWFGGVNQQIVGVVQNGMQRLRSRSVHQMSGTRQNFFNPRRLSPRQQLLFYYLALVQRGGEKGLPRGASQTPQEYSERLIKYITAESLRMTGKEEGKINRMIPGSPEQSEILEEITRLTEGFEEARYSRHEIVKDQASLMRQYWLSVSRVFRKWK
jgi:hypothetical protein